MATATGDLQALFSAGTAGNLSDAQLIERFLSGRAEVAEPAFATLVARHGNVVMGACQAILRDRHDAEDAFQATFLVFARKAGSVRNSEALGCWLYGVARRVAARARRLVARRRDAERRGALAMSNRTESCPADYWSELYEELDLLPTRYRAPIVLCDLEGHTYEEAARQLQCPRGTVQSRLSRGRERLRGRLLRRGITIASTALAATLFERPASAQVSAALCEQTTRAVLSGQAGGIVETLARSVLKTHVVTRLMSVGVLLGTAITVAVAIVVGLGGHEEQAAAAPASEPAAPAAPLVVKVVDALGHAMPNTKVQLLSHLDERSWKANFEGMVNIPSELIDGFIDLIARPDATTFGWVEYVPGRAEPEVGTRAQPLVLALRPLSRTMRGTIVDDSGRPIVGARVQVQGLSDATSQVHRFGAVPRGTPWPLGEAVTDETGEYRLPMPDHASASLIARHPWYIGPYIACPEQGDVIAPTKLKEAGQISGVVTDAETGRPVEGAYIGAQILIPNSDSFAGAGGQAVSDANGRYMIGGLEPEVYNVLFLRATGNPKLTAEAVEAVRVKARETVELPITARVGRRLHGTVVDDDTGQPLANMRIGYYGAARPRSGAAVMGTKSDAHGQFELFVPPGSAFVYIMHPGYGGRQREVNLVVPADRDPEPVAIQIFKHGPSAQPRAPGAMKAVVSKRVQREEPAATRALSGRVVDSAGKPLRGAHVYAGERFAATDREGRFQLTGLSKGAISLSFQRDGFTSRQDTVRADQDDLRVELTASQPPADVPAQPEELNEVPKPRTPAPAENVFFVNLQALANDRLVEGPGGGGNDLALLPSGLQAFGEDWFSVGRKMVHVAGQNTPELPPRVDGIIVGSRVKTLHFLHATQQAVENGTEIAAYQVNYGDGTHERIPIRYGVHIANWWDFGRKPELPTKASLAWSGRNKTMELNSPKWRIRLFDMSWPNPHPEKIVQTIDIISAGTLCDPFVVAITAERN